MHEISIEQDQTFLQLLYKRFDYLQDFPCEFRAMCIEDAKSLGVLHSDDFLGAVLGYPIEYTEGKHLSPDHFPFLAPEVNIKLSSYRLLTPVMPWPQPIIGVAMQGERGQLTGVHSTPVILNKIGNAQVWYGQDVGLIWEAFLEGQVQQDAGFESLMQQLWTICEDFLTRQGVTQIFVVARDPMFTDSWYQGHLQRLGYRPLTAESVAWLKPLHST